MHNILFYGDSIKDDAGAIYVNSPNNLFIEDTYIQVKIY